MRKSRRSTLDTVAGRAVTHEVGPVQGLTQRSSVSRVSAAAAPADPKGGLAGSSARATERESEIEPQIVSAITINDQIVAKGNQLSTRKNRDEQPPKKTWIELEKEAMTRGARASPNQQRQFQTSRIPTEDTPRDAGPRQLGADKAAAHR